MVKLLTRRQLLALIAAETSFRWSELWYLHSPEADKSDGVGLGGSHLLDWYYNGKDDNLRRQIGSAVGV